LGINLSALAGSIKAVAAKAALEPAPRKQKGGE
jgi:hypothetical protein